MLACASLLLFVAGAPEAPNAFPPIEAEMVGAPPPVYNRSFVSQTLGDHMVLQRAPRRAVVWGHTAPNATVVMAFNHTKYTATADAGGTWRHVLPAVRASTAGYRIDLASSTGERGRLDDVVFGDVWLCGGQSNMVFALPANANVTEEALAADAYSRVRLFTVGQGTSARSRLADLQTVEQPWVPASNASVNVGGRWGYFSAVCWFMGRRIADALGSEVPVGLVSSNWGGTKIESWTTEDTFGGCNRTGSDGALYNAMIHPYTVGPMALTGFAWYQGEQNTKDQQSADDYACLFPQMISSWRAAFAAPDAFFGFVQLSTWCHAGLQIPEMRQAQMAALALPRVGYATNADHGAGCNIHPTEKQHVGARLGDSALAVQYGETIAWRSPTYASASAAAAGGAATVTVTLDGVSDGGLTADVYPYNYAGLGRSTCAALNVNGSVVCAWAAVQFGAAGWANATVGVAGGGRRLTLSAAAPAGGAAATATAYGWGPVPMLNAYDKTTALPVLPWNRTL